MGRHTTLVELKVFALIVMFVAMTMWGENITDAATIAAAVSDIQQKLYATGHITTKGQYMKCLLSHKKT